MNTWDHAPELTWRISPIRATSTGFSLIVKGVLGIGSVDGAWTRYVPFGGSAADEGLAVQKAMSELVERVTWFATFHDLRNRGNLGGPYSTEGWAAHTDSKEAEVRSAGEYLEREYFKAIVAELTGKSSEGTLLSGAVAFHLDGDGLGGKSLLVPLYVEHEGIYLTYVVAEECLRAAGSLVHGTVFGMGHSSDLTEAVFNAKFEAVLVANALRRHFESGVTAERTGDNLSARETSAFARLFCDSRILTTIQERLTHAPTLPLGQLVKAVRLVTRLQITTLDFTWLQPPWLTQLKRHVCFTGATGGDRITQLLKLYPQGRFQR